MLVHILHTVAATLLDSVDLMLPQLFLDLHKWGPDTEPFSYWKNSSCLYVLIRPGPDGVPGLWAPVQKRVYQPHGSTKQRQRWPSSNLANLWLWHLAALTGRPLVFPMTSRVWTNTPVAIPLNSWTYKMKGFSTLGMPRAGASSNTCFNS